MKECVQHELLQPYPVLWEKEGDHIAHVKFTVLVMPNGRLFLVVDTAVAVAGCFRRQMFCCCSTSNPCDNGFGTVICLFTGTQRITAPVVDIDATCSSDKSLPEDLEKILVDAAEAAALKKAKKKKKKKKKKKN